MVLFDHRMVEGSPLRYYNPHHYQYLEYSMSEDLLMMPQSPASAQSDSENSMSSVELSVKHVKQIQCCWRSCGAVFESLDQLAAHVGKVHAASGPGGLFYCGWEGCTRNERGFNARYKMLVHVRTHTNEKPHQCYQCDKSFSRAENLKIHTRSHSGEKPYVCPVPGCKKAYSNSSDRFKHSRTHQEDKPYQCKVPGCPKRYTDPSSLRKHVKTYKHFADKPKTNCDCCVTSCLRGAAELLKLGAFIDGDTMSWNKLLDPFIAPRFEDCPIEPLDLSISRKQ